MKEEKTPFERAIDDGFAIMTKKEQMNQVGVLRKQEKEFKERYDNLIYLFLGSALGIVGGYIATWIYGLARNGFSINLIDIVFSLIFILLVFILGHKLMTHKSDVKMMEGAREMFEKNNVIITSQEKFNEFVKSKKGDLKKWEQ